MRHENRTRKPRYSTPAVAERARIRLYTSEGRRLRANDAARDHLASPGAQQATTVARRTAATWR